MTAVRLLGEDESVSLPESLLHSVGFTGLDSWMFFTRQVYGFPVSVCLAVKR